MALRRDHGFQRRFTVNVIIDEPSRRRSSGMAAAIHQPRNSNPSLWRSRSIPRPPRLGWAIVAGRLE